MIKVNDIPPPAFEALRLRVADLPLPPHLREWLPVLRAYKLVHDEESSAVVVGTPRGLRTLGEEPTTEGRALVMLAAYSAEGHIPLPATDGPATKSGISDKVKSAEVELTKVDQALTVLRKHPEWTNKKIAEKVGCSAALLSQDRSWRTARAAIKDAGKETKHRSGRSRGRDMNAYEAPDAGARGEVPSCHSCGDPADTRGQYDPEVLRGKDGRPRCKVCWLDLQNQADQLPG